MPSGGVLRIHLRGAGHAGGAGGKECPLEAAQADRDHGHFAGDAVRHRAVQYHCAVDPEPGLRATLEEQIAGGCGERGATASS